MLKWILIVLGALIGSVVLMALIGLLLPKAHIATSSITLQQPTDSVWAVVRDLGDHPTWWADIESSERLEDRNGHEVWLQRDRRGASMPLEVVMENAPSHLVTRIAADDLPFAGTWTYEIEPVEGGCRVTVTEAGEVYNPLFRFVSRFVFGHHATLESFLAALGQRFGERPTVTRSKSD
jgi:uncharacterized protein YndB with AHSA1/START domain